MATKKTTKNSKPYTLVIVESPAKAQTIEKYLGAGYKVMASKGHLIDLPKSKIGVDPENNFAAHYITIRGKGELLKELQKAASKARLVLLASDNDREGEAIAYHLNNALKDKTGAQIKRVVFNEITPTAIKSAIKNPGEITESKVDAQKARRILDRLVGYNLSPVLWKKVKGGLSAGRVQSVALRLICEREEEVLNWTPEEYWTLESVMAKGRVTFPAQLNKVNGKKADFKSQKEIDDLIKAIEKSTGSKDTFPADILAVKETPKTIKPQPPFTTSKLQQTAANRLGFTSKRTMKIAQELYEGVDIGSGRVGLITYMRTDSVRISDEAISDVRNWIGENKGEWLPEKPNYYTTSSKAQDAHEGIRPTYTKNTPSSVQKSLTPEQYKLYSIIWERFVSSQMKNAVSIAVSAEIGVGKDPLCLFSASSSKIATEGFYSVLDLLKPKEEKSGKLPSLKVGEKIECRKLMGEQHFTSGPARYTDASIVKTLEEKGIGRPSTYAPIISVLLDRFYATRVNKSLQPTVLGKVINKILTESFSNVINEQFTADIETKLDRIEQGQLSWTDEMKKFYFPFKTHVDEVLETASKEEKKSFDEKTDLTCQKCGRPMVKKLGRYGYFYACSGFPECKNAIPIPLAKCPKCKTGDIVERRAKGRGKKFFGCTNYPECDFITYSKPLGMNCPKCGWFLVEKYSKKNGSVKACINPQCNYLHIADDE